jgi:hypothetical protein
MIMWVHTSGETSAERPKRVRLPDHTTRTSEAVTDEILAEAGWQWIETAVSVEPEIVLSSSGTFL